MSGLLYLSSYKMGKDTEVLRAPTAGARAGVVCNARDVWMDTRRRNFDQECQPLIDLGWTCAEMDLRTWFDGQNSIDDVLSELQMVWVLGGNAFVLAQAMDRSGFRTAVRRHLARGLVYGGYSAGACVAGPDLQGIHLMDDPHAIPAGYLHDEDPPTLKLVPWRIIPHWQSDHPEREQAELARTWLEELDLPYRALRDGETIVRRWPA